MPFFVKKCLTNGGWGGIISKLSARAAKKCQNEDQFKRIRKIFLTNDISYGIIKQLRNEKQKLGAQQRSSKNIERTRKKFLTSSKSCDIIKKFTANLK